MKGKVCFNDATGKPGITNSPTDTLITKILLGTLGCIPAYDRMAKAAMGSLNITQTFSEKGITQIVEFAQEHRIEIEQTKNEIRSPYYSYMKIIDMYLWEFGAKIEREKKVRRTI